MAAHVEYSNFSSGYAWAKCSECGWKGQKHIGAGKLSNDQARKEADAHDAEAHAPATTYKLVGENTLTGNAWDCVTGIATRAEALELRNGWARLEADYKIEYRVEEEPEMHTFHTPATLTADELTAEIDEAFLLGAEGPGFCKAHYVGLAVCQRIGNHDGEHVVKGHTGRLIAF
ncbi:hypothetical protein SEA_ASCELA_61 [Arthrobacter phage Ascela]|uniref:Uncharacterized protein n=1 Tax=Arthrobacter phage Ascela TaxID=3038360 RepID=A0AAF0GJC4_9CAUD|nr:hypothetical protein SEA_ASCELA_61 [Arthrobacter phage Ascela]